MDKLNRIRLLLGDDAVSRLRGSTVMVVGCGAVGSFAIEALARSGIGHLILIDSDVVEESNINRQLFALTSTIGQAKVDVASGRIHDINPEIKTTALKMFFDSDTQLSVRPDFIIDAIDTAQSKIALYRWAQNNGIPLIASMGAARKRDVSALRVAMLSRSSVCPLAARMRRMVRDAGLSDIPVVFSVEPAAPQNTTGHTFGSIVTVTGAFGLMLANYVIDDLTRPR